MSDARIEPFKGMVSCGPPPNPALLRDIQRICEHLVKDLNSSEQMGYNTTCTVSKDAAMAGIEVTANTKQAMIPIERLRPVTEKMMGRF